MKKQTKEQAIEQIKEEILNSEREKSEKEMIAELVELIKEQNGILTKILFK